MKIHRLPLPQYPEIYAEYIIRDGRKDFIGIVTPHGDPIEKLCGSLLTPQGVPFITHLEGLVRALVEDAASDATCTTFANSTALGAVSTPAAEMTNV